MKNRYIGHISKVFFNKIIFEVFETENLSFNYKGEFYQANGLNDFISINSTEGIKYIYQVVGLYEKEKPLLEVDHSKFNEIAYFEAIPLGELYQGEFTFGLSKFPMIGNEVFLSSYEDIQCILSDTKSNLTLTLGKIRAFDYYPSIDINKLFTTHMSVLGNTGSGKSTTLRKLIFELINNRMINNENLNFIIFDLHGEYKTFPEQCLEAVEDHSFAIPTKTLTFEDWINLVNPAALVQLPMLMNGLRIASLVFSDVDEYKWIYAYCALELYNYQATDAVAKRSKIMYLLGKVNDSQINAQLSNYDAKFGNFGNVTQENNFKTAIENYLIINANKTYSECSSYLHELLKVQECCISELKDVLDGIELALILEESKGNSAARGHSTTLITRVENIIQTYSSTLFDSNQEKIRKFEEINLFKKAITVFDVSSYDNQDLLFLSSYIMRNTFENQKLIKSSGHPIQKVYHFLLDEAHRYITEENDDNNIKPKKIFERISKEGRKFGVFMIIASQRPGELSKTVLSQCNNYILHRIRNNLDLDQLKRSIPYLNDLQLFRLSFLKSGTGLFVGDAFTFPMEIDVDGEEYSYTSSTVDLNTIWN